MKERWVHFLPWLIVVFAFLLRVPLLSGSFWLDEAAQALESVRPFSEQWRIFKDFQPPLLHYLIHFATRISLTEWWLRWWGALLPGLITVFAVFQLGKKLFNTQVGSVAALLLATSSFHIFYSQELRPYSLPTALAMMSALLLFDKAFSWKKFTVVSLLGCYSSYLYPFFLIVQALILWRRPQVHRSVLLSGALITLGCLPLTLLFFRQLTIGQQLRSQLPGWENVVSTPQLKALALVPLKFMYGVTDLQQNTWYVSTFLLAVGLAMSGGYHFVLRLREKKYTKPERNRFLSLTFLASVPLLLSWVVSFVVPVIQPKRLLFLLPIWYLLLTALTTYKKKFSLNAAWGLIGMLFVLNILGTWHYWTQPVLQRENWRGMKQTLFQTLPPTETIAVFSFEEPFAPWRWYEPPVIPSLATGALTTHSVEDLSATLRPVTQYRYVVVFDYLRTLTDPENHILTTLEEFGFEGRGVIDYPGIGFVRIYSRPGNAIGYTL